MSTRNFMPTEPLPLFALPDDRFMDWVCPYCETKLNEVDGSYQCPDCGCTTNYPEEDGCYQVFDFYGAEEWERYELDPALEQLNESLEIVKLSYRHGYYEGVQLVLNDPEGISVDGAPDNDYCLYQFGRSKKSTWRRYKRELGRIVTWLEDTARDLGFKRYECLGVFSNGEAVYAEVHEGQEQKSSVEVTAEANVINKAA